MTPQVLIIVTYLGGSAWGPQVSQQEYASAQACHTAREHVLHTVEEMNRSNLVAGRSAFRKIISAECLKR